ncbi:MAG: LacI family transcriptional regulator [Bifidobacteriaceae bacterium]|jgi:LacI family transcriptional regulator|nr:LacI family transcriptional regulator [Bifidobacteriaceae bacterium]
MSQESHEEQNLQDAAPAKSTPNRRIGISDVAKRASVSIGTVSNYLNYPDRVSDRLKLKIQTAIEELGYARTQKRRTVEHELSTPVIGYIIADIENYLFTSIFEGIQEVCDANGMEVIGVHALQDKERQSDLVHMLCQMNVSGLLISSVDDSQDDLAFAKAAGIPAVMVDHLNPPIADDHCTVLKNDDAAGEIAARELIRTGCTRLAYVAHLSDFQPIRNRERGIEKALEDTRGGNGAAPASLDIIDSGGVLFQDGYEIGKDIEAMDPKERPDGIIAGTDRIATGIITALVEGGKVRVPDDVSVIGTEGDHLETQSPRSLTVVSSPGIDMGRKAMDQLVDEITNASGHIHSTQLLMPTLERRDSTRH